MKFLVRDIEFDFNTDMPDYYSVSYDDQQLIVNDNLGVWEADDEDDLIEEVTTACGWCIKSIDYDIQLKQWHTTPTIEHGMDYNNSITKEFHYELYNSLHRTSKQNQAESSV